MWVEKHGKTYRIRDRIGGDVVTVRSGYPTKTAANTAIKLMVADNLRGDALMLRGGRITLNEFIDGWWPSHERTLKPLTIRSEGGRLRNHIRPLLGRLALDEIDADVVQSWVNDLEHGVGEWPAAGKRRKLSPKTILTCHGLLYVIMQAAIAARRIRANPCAGTKLPRREPHEMRFLTDPEIARLVSATPPHWRPLVLLLVVTGLRWGEAIGLRVGRLDLLAPKPRLTVVEQLQELHNGELRFMSPKSARSRRTVSFTRKVALELASLVAGRNPDEVVFLTPRGLKVRTRNFRRVWLRATEAAGLKGLRVHDLRHTHAAILISAGRPLSAISRRLGHSSITVTDLLYGHIREEADDGIIDALESALSHVHTDIATEVTAELAGHVAA